MHVLAERISCIKRVRKDEICLATKVWICYSPPAFRHCTRTQIWVFIGGNAILL